MADGTWVGFTVGVGCGTAVGLQAEFEPQTGPQVVSQSQQVAQEWPQVELEHPLVAQAAPQVELPIPFAPQNAPKVESPHQLVEQLSCCAGMRFLPVEGRAAYSASETVAVEASIIAAASAVYFLNMLVHLRSITVLLQTVA